MKEVRELLVLLDKITVSGIYNAKIIALVASQLERILDINDADGDDNKSKVDA